MRNKMIEALEFLFTIFGTLCAVTMNLALVGAGYLLGVMVAFENIYHTVGVLFVFLGFLPGVLSVMFYEVVTSETFEYIRKDYIELKKTINKKD